MKRLIKSIFNVFSLIVVFPSACLCWIETLICPHAELIYNFWAHFYAFIPGIVGVMLRRAFYKTVLEKCSLNCHIGFGSVFTHRKVVVEDNVSIGLYAVIGSASIGKNCEIASRVSIVSGKHQHTRDSNGKWTAFHHTRMKQTRISPNVWIGEGAIIMADIGEGSLVGAGAVVIKDVPENVVVAGNPAKILKKLKAQ